MSDTQSIQSFSIDAPSVGMQVEEIGQLSLSDISPRRIIMLNHTLAILTEDGKLVLGDLRTSGGEEWQLTSKSIANLSKDEKKIIDIALLPGPHGIVVILLIERKSKERYLSAHNIKRGTKSIELGEEFSSYDKANVLGKGVSHISGDLALAGGEPSVYSVSNLVRKLRLEDGGSSLKPTPARAQVPAEYQDGILTFCVQPITAASTSGASRPSTATRPSQYQQANVVIASKTKSASPKSKFAIDWFLSGKKDELTNCKSTLKLGEDSEPVALLVDPKDSKHVYALTVNRSTKSTSLFKLGKGRRSEEPIITFNFEISIAATGLSADPLSSSSVPTTLLLAYDESQGVIRIFTIQKTEGFRGRHAACAHCGPLELISSPSHVISCATNRWQLSPNQVDLIFCHQPRIQVGLASLIDGTTGRIVLEPDQGIPYRLRVLGCDAQGLHPEAIILEDLERIFEDGADDSKMCNAVLKICLAHQPCRDCQSQMSAMLMAGRLGAIEVHYVSPTDSQPNGSHSGSDRFVLKPISGEKFRSIITDLDWTQIPQRQGTFTLTPDSGAVTSTPARGPSPRTSRIPTPKSSTSAQNSTMSSSFYKSTVSQYEDDVDAEGDSLRDDQHHYVTAAAATLSTVLELEMALKNNLTNLQAQFQELQRRST